MSYLFANVGGNVYEAKRNKIEHEAGSFSAVESHFVSFDFLIVQNPNLKAD